VKKSFIGGGGGRGGVVAHIELVAKKWALISTFANFEAKIARSESKKQICLLYFALEIHSLFVMRDFVKKLKITTV
jgi:hypothetical protein